MPEPILIDILLPTYEPRPEHLRAAVECILAQTETRWSLFIHDDCSKTDVRAIVEEFLADERITFKRSDTRLGIGGNWNACVRQTRAPFVQFLFQDDLWEPEYLTTSLHEMNTHPSISLTFAAHAYTYEGEIVKKEEFEKVKHVREILASGLHNGHVFLQSWIGQELHPNLIGEPSFVLLRRSVLQKTGPFDETMPQFLDVDMWIRCLLHGDLSFISESLGSFRVHPSSASMQNDASGAGIYDRLRCFERLIPLLPRGELRQSAIHARNEAVTGMARKFFARVKDGKTVKSKGSGAIKRFAMRHPFVVAKALFNAMLGL